MTLLQLKTIEDKALKAPEELKRGFTLSMLKEAFFNHMTGKSENTLKEYHRSVDRLHVFMETHALKNIHDIQGSHLRLYQDYYHGKGYSDVTIHYDFKTLSRFCKILSSLGFLDINPFVR